MLEVLQSVAGAIEQFRDRYRWRHQQTFVPHEVDGCGLAGGEIGLHRQTLARRPLLGGQQHCGRAVRKRRAVACGQGRLRPFSEGGAQGGEFFRAGVAANVVVARQPAPALDQRVEKAIIPGRRCLVVTFGSEQVLLLAGDFPLTHHALAVLPHGQAGPRLGVGRRLRRQFPEAEAA